MLIGTGAWWFGVGETLSYDVSAAFAAPATPTNVVIVTMDETAYAALEENYGAWKRSTHAKLLRRLKADGSGAVIFDVTFFDASTNAADDSDFANAIREHGHVILSGSVERTSAPGLVGETARRPLGQFLNAALDWGVPGYKQGDGVVRRHATDTDLYKTLPSAAASVLCSRPTTEAANNDSERWLRYYADIPKLSYQWAFDRADGYFKDKIVMIGGKPSTLKHMEEADEFRSPLTGDTIGGVEVHMTMLLNLLRADWLVRLPSWLEAVSVIVVSLLIGFGLPLLKPITGGLTALGCALAIGAAALFCVTYAGAWFPWLGLVGLMVPGAWIASLASYKQEARISASSYPEEFSPPLVPTEGAPHVPGYALLRSIGRGAYGEVWIARNHIGTYNAVKLVFRNRLPEGRAYEREFRGIRKYTPVSLRHPGLVKILHVGRDDKAQHFHYVMELGDDETTAQEINPDTYQPRNLAKDLARKGRLSVTECVAMGIALCEPLEFLHSRRLMHRDIKPANIIFFDGIPKLADVGLVTEYTRDPGDMSYMGTEGYMAEPPTKPSSDIYSFGKVLYEAVTGLDRRQFPVLPEWINSIQNVAEFMALNSIILRCCDPVPRKRYQHAGELLQALVELERGFGNAA